MAGSSCALTELDATAEVIKAYDGVVVPSLALRRCWIRYQRSLLADTVALECHETHWMQPEPYPLGKGTSILSALIEES